jgi:hypothetical protein
MKPLRFRIWTKRVATPSRDDLNPNTAPSYIDFMKLIICKGIQRGLKRRFTSNGARRSAWSRPRPIAGFG